MQDVKHRGELSKDLATRALVDFARAAGVETTDKRRVKELVQQAAGGHRHGKVRGAAVLVESVRPGRRLFLGFFFFHFLRFSRVAVACLRAGV